MAFLPVFSPFLLLLVVSCSNRVISEPVRDKQALLAFLSQVPHANRLQWNESDSACNWVGVVCDGNRTSVHELRLPGVDLVGRVPPNTLGNLTQLQVLSLRSNRLSGQIPSDFSNLTLLRSLYLQNNEFSGEFPPISPRLIHLDISSNRFSGPIPLSISNLTHLTRLYLQNNNFSDTLLTINSSDLTDFNVSNNNLNGSIPSILSKFPSSSFAGNPNLCGSPLPACFQPSETKPKSENLSTAAIILISIGSVLVAFILIICLILILRKSKQRQTKNLKRTAGAVEAGTSSDIMGGSTEREKSNKLVFTEGGIYNFDLEDLLRASAEVLSRGSVGTSYKAVLEEGTTVVVKRLKDVVSNRTEFEAQMGVVGKIKHENVLPLRAFYYSRDEKLLVYDFMPAGSLSALLHGSRGSGRTPLDWDSRRRVAVSAARGLTHLHSVAKVVHGNIKSSNVLLRPNYEACLSDLGLNPLFDPTAPSTRLAGYRAPEVLETRKVTFKSDIYSFGVLILELLTGKAPNQASLGDEGIDLPRWVQSVVREEWTAEVFDSELMRYHNIEEEMVQLLQVAMACVSIVPDQRPPMLEVVKMIDDINRSDTDDGLSPSKGSDGHTPKTPVSGVTP